jgi:PEGA domain-containing protein
MTRFRDAGRSFALLLLLTAVLSQAGCVERRYTIRTNPPGALVIVNGEEIGPTPVSRSFTYYGDREITFMLDGYKTETVIQPIKAPWFDNVLTEFFTENIIPHTFRDERDFTFNLQPAQLEDVGPIRDRGEAIRSQAQVLPAPRRGGILGYFGF